MLSKKSWYGTAQEEGQHRRYSRMRLPSHGSTHVLHIDSDEVDPTGPADNLP